MKSFKGHIHSLLTAKYFIATVFNGLILMQSGECLDKKCYANSYDHKFLLLHILKILFRDGEKEMLINTPFPTDLFKLYYSSWKKSQLFF